MAVLGLPRPTLADTLYAQLKVAGVDPLPQREYRFAEALGRRWAADLCWPELSVIVECEGGIWKGGKGGGVAKGRHSYGQGYVNDISKYNAATLLGYRVFRVTSTMIKSGEAFGLVEEILGQAARPWAV